MLFAGIAVTATVADKLETAIGTLFTPVFFVPAFVKKIGLKRMQFPVNAFAGKLQPRLKGHEILQFFAF